MAVTDLPYLRGTIPPQHHPLSNFYPPYRERILPVWLRQQGISEGLILDSLGSHPQLALEAARSGYRVLAAVNNPITRFLLHQLVNPPSGDELQAAVAALAGSFKGNERLEPHLLSLYETECPHCRERFSAQAFLWNKKKGFPVRKVCHCPACSDRGEYPTTQEDIEKALSFQDQSLAQARALTRVAPPQNSLYDQVEKALQIYTPRAVYALFALINKFTALPESDPHRRPLAGLLLSTFNRTHGLTPKEGGQSADLKLPAQYREDNVWLAFRDSVNAWSRSFSGIPLRSWPELAEPGEITLFPGRFRELAEDLPEKEIAAAIIHPPRPNQVFWSLSALWSGWLWGQDSAAVLRNILSLNNLDWPWFVQALEDNLAHLVRYTSPAIPCLGILPDLDLPLLTSSLTAARAAGLNLVGLALSPDPAEAQVLWEKGPGKNIGENPPSRVSILRDGGYQHLKQSGEPSHTLQMAAGGLIRIVQGGVIPPGKEIPVVESYQEIQDSLEETYAYRQGFLHYPEINRWWHQELTLPALPLTDQMEVELVQLLTHAEGPVRQEELESHLYNTFPGLNTPDAEALTICLNSYGEQLPDQPGSWRLHPGDLPGNRLRDQREMVGLLDELGREMGFNNQQLPPIGGVQVRQWIQDHNPQATFFISASALLNKILLKNPDRPPSPWIVLPGSRAKWVTHKLNQNPPLQDLIDQGWGFLKFRHLRRLAEEGSLTEQNFRERFRLDPLTYDAPQLPLI